MPQNCLPMDRRGNIFPPASYFHMHEGRTACWRSARCAVQLRRGAVILHSSKQVAEAVVGERGGLRGKGGQKKCPI